MYISHPSPLYHFSLRHVGFLLIAFMLLQSVDVGAQGLFRRRHHKRESVRFTAYAGDTAQARRYFQANQFDKALDAYDHSELTVMDVADIGHYAMSAFFLNDFSRSLALARYGLSRDADDTTCRRLAFFCMTEQGHCAESLSCADTLFALTPDSLLSYYDYVYHGKALDACGQSDSAIVQFHKALQHHRLDDANARVEVARLLSTAYYHHGDYRQAISSCQQYISATPRPTIADLSFLADLYVQHSAALPEPDRSWAFQQADSVYLVIEQSYPSAIAFAVVKRARLRNLQDPTQTGGLARPYYEKVVSLLEPIDTLDAPHQAYLKESYLYLLSYYYNIRGDVSTARHYAQKVLQLAPDNPTALQVLADK